MSDDPDDAIIDKSGDRGFLERYFLKKNGLIDTIEASEVMEVFLAMHKKEVQKNHLRNSRVFQY